MMTPWHILLPASGDPKLVCVFFNFSFSWSPLGKADLLISLAAPSLPMLAYRFLNLLRASRLNAICLISSRNAKFFRVPGLPKAPYPVSGAAMGTHHLSKMLPVTLGGFGEGGRSDDRGVSLMHWTRNQDQTLGLFFDCATQMRLEFSKKWLCPQKTQLLRAGAGSWLAWGTDHQAASTKIKYLCLRIC